MSYETTLRQRLAKDLTEAKNYPHPGVGRQILIDAFYYTGGLLGIKVAEIIEEHPHEEDKNTPEPGKTGG